jgi:hypothetical protein
MDYAMRESLVTFRRLLAAALCVSLLVAFWAERPTGAASFPTIPAEAVGAGRSEGGEPVRAASTTTSIISFVRRPWLGFYTLVGAPAITQKKLTEEEMGQFRIAVFRLAMIFLTLSAVLWWRGRRLIVRSRKT